MLGKETHDTHNQEFLKLLNSGFVEKHSGPEAATELRAILNSSEWERLSPEVQNVWNNVASAIMSLSGPTDGHISPDEYQERAALTRSLNSDSVHLALMLASESGEVAGIFQKSIYQGHDPDLVRDKLKYELGDVMWCVINLCADYQLSLEEVMLGNLEKLQKRHGSKFSVEASVNQNAQDPSRQA